MSHNETTVERTSSGIPHGRIALWWFLVSEVGIFGSLISVYLMFRLLHPEWMLHSAHTVTWAGATNTTVLLTSSLTAVLAHAAAGRGDFARARMMTIGTLCGAMAFLVIKSYEYSVEFSHGFYPNTNLFWSFYFVLTGLHALHVIIGGSALAYVYKTQLIPETSARGIEYAGMYWHLVDIVWIFLFPLLYLSA